MLIPERVKQFRIKLGYSQAELAAVLCTTKASVTRWESGASKPSRLAAKALEEIGFGEIVEKDTNKDSLSRLDHLPPESLMDGVVNEIWLYKKKVAFVPPPYVINGPENQLRFFAKLVELQQHDGKEYLERSYLHRLSVVQEIDGIRTSQSQLENPKTNARSWSSNYGTHGWHRYVGRFPPHLVRSLINHFDLQKGDTVLDPFVGSGTTLVEARLLGINGIGIDICPLSSLISRAKTQYPLDTLKLENSVEEYDIFFDSTIKAFLKKHQTYDVDTIINWTSNPIPAFANYQKWFSKEALLGTSITVQFINLLRGYEKDFFSCQLSSLMRSIGNVEVNVVRAEYSKKTRENVNVKKLMIRRSFKSIKDIRESKQTHETFIRDGHSIKIFEDGLQQASIVAGSVDAIITSPPYGVESISYLRTHLLSYRSLVSVLKHDPYSNSENIIGSEYISKENYVEHLASEYSPTYTRFFANYDGGDLPKKLIKRVEMMKGFFDDMVTTAQLMKFWLKPAGQIAFVVGNKKLGDHIIPTHEIISEIFKGHGLLEEQVIKHKLKTNNSNSQVPWQSRIIQDEYIILYRSK